MKLTQGSFRADAAALRAVRAVRRARGDRLSAGDVSYRIYLVIMLTIIVVAPAVRTLVLGAAPVLPDLVQRPGALAALFTAATAGVVFLGGRGGPARAGLPQLDLLFPTPIARWRLVAPPVVRWLIAGAALGVLLGGVWAIAAALRGPVPTEVLAAVVVAGLCLGVLFVGALLGGQVGTRARTVLAGTLAVLVVAQLLWRPLYDPWSAVARVLELSVLPGVGPSGAAEVVAVHAPSLLAALATPVAAALVVVCGAVPLAARLPRELLREQAVNWDAASALALTGDPTAALARFGAPVTLGRRFRLRPSSRLWGMLFRRDVLGLIRAPGRSLAAAVGTAFAGALWAVAVQSGAGLGGAALMGAVAVAVGSLSVQPWCRGMVTAAGGAGSPALLPLSPGALIAAHALTPLVASTLAVAGGAAAAISFTTLGLGAWQTTSSGFLAVWSAPVLAAVLVLLRAAAALKGTIPLRLLAPVPTPMGDVSAMNVFIWTIDGPVVALLVGGALGAAWSAASPIAVAVTTGVALVCLGAWAYSRLRPSLTQ